MTKRSSELLLALLQRPDYTDSKALFNATSRIFHDEVQGEELLRILAEQSPAQARAVLAWAGTGLYEWELEERVKVIDAVEEHIEGKRMATLPDDELQARAMLHVLLPPDAEGMPLRTRILAWGLQERHPELAASVLLHLAEDYYFLGSCVPLRKILVPKLQDSAPHLALPLLSHHQEALGWLHRLLDESPCNEEQIGLVLNALTTQHWGSGITWEHLIGLGQKMMERRVAVLSVFLRYLIHWLRAPRIETRQERITQFFDFCKGIPTSERRELGSDLLKEVGALIPRPERSAFLRRLSHWLRPALQGPEDELQRMLQGDRAISLLMHLPIRRLVTAHLWQEKLAGRHRRRFMRRRNQLWQPYLQRRKLMLELAGTLEAIAVKKSQL